MAIYDTVKGNIVRQELQLVEAGQHYKIYSGKVKYSPDNIEKEDFFRLCYGMLTKCDEINIYTAKANEYEILYKFIVINVDIDAKQVTTRLLSKVDFLNEETTTKTSNEGTGITAEKVQKLIEKSLKTGPTLEDITKLIDEKIKAMSEVVAGIDTKVEGLIEATTKYQVDTDDQLEEIEAKLESLATTEQVEQTETVKTKATTKAKTEQQ